MSNWLRLVLFAVSIPGLFLSTHASAEISYDYFELRYVDAEIDNSNVDGDGFEIGGSFRINEDFFAVGSYTDLDFDFGFDGTILQIGGGYIHQYKKNIDFIGQAQFVDVDIDPGGSDSGFALAAGVRSHIMPSLEVRGFFNYVDVDDSDTFVELAADYFFTERFAAGGSLDIGGDTDTITLGVRYFFDR